MNKFIHAIIDLDYDMVERLCRNVVCEGEIVTKCLCKGRRNTRTVRFLFI